MHRHSIPRFLIASLLFTIIISGAAHFSAAAKGTSNRTETTSRENIPVQSCGGFDITSSYTVTRNYLVVEDYPGHQVVERREVSFSGALASTTDGQSFLYDGQFTRTADYDQGTSQITDLLLHFEVGTPNEITYAQARPDFDLIDNPAAVIQAIVPNALHMDLCYLFRGSVDLKPLQTLTPSQAIPASVPPEYRERIGWSAKVQPATTGEEGPNWSQLDPCDTTPPGKPC